MVDSISDERAQQLRAWLLAQPPALGLAVPTLRPASADASFRRYFRLDAAGVPGGSAIAMDAPPDKEDCRPFVHVAQLLAAAGVHAPRVLAADLTQGFLLLTDLGHATYLAALRQADATRADALMSDAIDALLRWQQATQPGQLPAYDEALMRRELNLFPDWYVARHLGRDLSTGQRLALEPMGRRILDACLAQPTVYVHRDYMPRNLMVAAPNPGVLDFQDAVAGPIAYDLASLLRDAFLSWDEEREIDWAIRYWERARRVGLPVRADFGAFWRDLEWMALQRHLKVLGIFARINYRDGKPHYLADAPRFVRYVRATALRYDELVPLLRLFDELGIVAP
ncbi:MAG: aminoglycoside phosphotransferase family protein [Betaproteobacteria bacterium]